MPTKSKPPEGVAPPLLGTIGKFVATQETSPLAADERIQANRYAILAERFRLQATSRALLPDFAVSKCLRAVIPTAPGVRLSYNSLHKRGGLHDLITCKSPWICPVCAAHISEARRRELQNLDRAAREAGYTVALVTLTFSHHGGQPLADLVYRLLEAVRKLSRQRSYRDLRMRYGVVGWIRALEVTYSRLNGWHPHLHLLVYLPAATHDDLSVFGEAFRAEWENALAKVGLTCNRRGFQLDNTNARVAEYVAKWGKLPGWDEAAEVTKSHVKHGRQAHATPFDLLRLAAEDDGEAATLFQEFALAFKGRSQLRATPGLAEKLLGRQLLSDEEAAEDGEGDRRDLALLYRSGWRKVISQDARAELLHSLDAGDVDELAELLDALSITPAEWVQLLDEESEDVG